jgi:hypothetical protein
MFVEFKLSAEAVSISKDKQFSKFTSKNKVKPVYYICFKFSAIGAKLLQIILYICTSAKMLANMK